MVASPKSRAGWLWILSTSGLAALWISFAVANLQAWRTSDHPVGLGAMTMELVVAGVYVGRRQAVAVSHSPLAWFAAGLGAFGLLAARPAYHPVGGQGTLFLCLQLIGAVAATGSLLTLGRSFGVVAANRGIETRGPYRIVRHPVYSSYLVGMAGYLLENPSLRNTILFGTVIFFQLLRIRAEEACLGADPQYTAYRSRVRYRLVPFVY